MSSQEQNPIFSRSSTDKIQHSIIKERKALQLLFLQHDQYCITKITHFRLTLTVSLQTTTSSWIWSKKVIEKEKLAILCNLGVYNCFWRQTSSMKIPLTKLAHTLKLKECLFVSKNMSNMLSIHLQYFFSSIWFVYSFSRISPLLFLWFYVSSTASVLFPQVIHISIHPFPKEPQKHPFCRRRVKLAFL